MAEYKERMLANEGRIWRLDLLGKAEQGKVFLNRMKGMFKELPSDPWIVRDLWCQAFELTEQIQAGLACLHAHIDYESSD
jgi:hypothetical protein